MNEHEYTRSLRLLTLGVTRLAKQLRSEACFESAENILVVAGRQLVFRWHGPAGAFMVNDGGVVKLPSNEHAPHMAAILVHADLWLREGRRMRDEVVTVTATALAALEVVLPRPTEPPPGQVVEPAEVVEPRRDP